MIERDLVVRAQGGDVDPKSGSWIPVAAMSRARRGQVAAGLPDGSVLIVGGDQAGDRASAERYVRPSGKIERIASRRRPMPPPPGADS